MPVIRSGLFTILRRYPSLRNRLQRLYVSDQSFRILCDDFRLCAETLAYWQQSPLDRAQERCLEYMELQTSLEQEIEEFLKRGQLSPKHGADLQ